MKLKVNWKKVLPAGLTILSAGGVVLTTVLAVKATPKVLEDLEKIKAEKKGVAEVYMDNELKEFKLLGEPTAVERLQVYTKRYLPAVLVGMATVTCMASATILSQKSQASIAGAYALVSDSFKRYRKSAKNVFGEDADEKIIDDVEAHMTECERKYISAPNFMGSTSLEQSDEEERLFLDVYSNRYFYSTLSRVIEAEYHTNRNLVLGAEVSLNDFYDFLGIDKISGGDLLWSICDDYFWIDFDNQLETLEDGREVYKIYFPFEPEPKEYWGLYNG